MMPRVFDSRCQLLDSQQATDFVRLDHTGYRVVSDPMPFYNHLYEKADPEIK